MKSIRRFLVIILLAVITLINFLAAVQGYRAGISQVQDTLDLELNNIARMLAGVRSDAVNLVAKWNPESLAYQIWQEQGSLVERTPNTPDTAIAPFAPGFGYSNFNAYRWRSLSFFDQGQQRWFLVAQRMDSRYLLADSIILNSILPILVGIPVAGLMIWLVVGSGLSPLYRLVQQLGQKQEEDLTPLQQQNLPIELEQVHQSINHLLRRLEKSFAREKRFASDAAHELRTPISILKVHLHNLLFDHPAIQEDVEPLRQGIERLEHLVEQILALNRSSPDQFLEKFESVDLQQLAREVVAEDYYLFENKEQQVELEGNSVWVSANRFAVITLLKNLLSNANKYSPPCSDIRVSTGEFEARPYLRVEDSGPGISEDLYEKVFERFYRVASTGESIQGSGLGLAIVKHIAEQHGAIIRVSPSSFDSGLAITLLFPRFSLSAAGGMSSE